MLINNSKFPVQLQVKHASRTTILAARGQNFGNEEIFGPGAHTLDQ